MFLLQADCSVDGEMKQWIVEVKEMFDIISLGEVILSPYDTAWIAMVPSLEGSIGPQFPSSLAWILENQQADGSWGYRDILHVCDRMSNTLACIVALKKWKVGHENIQKGIEFIEKNIYKLEKDSGIYMTTGFEITFPSMLDDAKDLDIDLPYHAQVFSKLRDKRCKNLMRFPLHLENSMHTILLHSLEGLHRSVDWDKVLRFLTGDGSVLLSPASTACALHYTKDERCLRYLERVLNKFNDAGPVDMYERLWMVDRLERLGISRYFLKEIDLCLDDIYRNGWARASNVSDVDDTSMAFRLLRLHGYPVSPDVFSSFKFKSGFLCFEEQTSQDMSRMHNLCRASHIKLPNEPILEEAKNFAERLLESKMKEGKLHDKRLISESLKEEIPYTLKNPWRKSLQRIETRNFIEHYTVDDIWVANSLYRMRNINNELLLKLAKADYNMCQQLHKSELIQVLRWNEGCEFDQLDFARQKPIECFFAAASTLFEPQYSLARRVWTISGVLTTIIDDFFDVRGTLEEISMFSDAIKRWDPQKANGLSHEMRILLRGIYSSVTMITEAAYAAQERDVTRSFQELWIRYINSICVEAQWKFSYHSPTLTEYMNNGRISIALKPILLPTLLFMGERINEQELQHEENSQMMDLVCTIGRINNDIQGFQRELKQGKHTCVGIFLKENPEATTMEAINHFKRISEDSMDKLLKLYLEGAKNVRTYKCIYLSMAKILNFFYDKVDGYSSPTIMKEHIRNTLYEPIL
ncbi:hypothetical protein KP509_39G028800 [Ceratopteris richardii]|uniref:PH domain-containing protein n=1 Tax=Ceratopteris richardii TaxID=49495 RepID=A0A8T2Q035_CERRI|nr:hypothetical protein KP509_39G028800 [Ceratopteris richardii]